MKLSVSVTEKGGGTFVVAPSGYIDTNTYPLLEKELNSLLERSAAAIILDMKDVAYISSLGIGIILRTKKILKERNGRLLMANLQPRIKRIFEIIYTKPDAEIFATMEEALAYLERMKVY